MNEIELEIILRISKWRNKYLHPVPIDVRTVNTFEQLHFCQICWERYANYIIKEINNHTSLYCSICIEDEF
jgi:hypothetical protein